MLSLADVLILIIVFGFAFAGFFFGLIHTFGSLVGTIAGFLVASKFSWVVAGWLEPLLGSSGVVKVIIFILLFLLASRLVGFIFWIVEKVFNFVSIVPFIKSINRLLGAVLGFLEGIIIVGAVLYYTNSILPEWVLSLGGTSSFSTYTVAVFKALFGFIPGWIL
ncbi:MAG: CvpA family protein [Patescibacteria group bacterium]